jgi:hypothetical protein
MAGSSALLLFASVGAVLVLGTGVGSAGPAPGDYYDTVLNDQPQGYWRLGDQTPTDLGDPGALDESQNGYDGTYAAGVSLGTSSPGLYDGSTAASFPASPTPGIAVPGRNSLDVGSSDFSVELWTRTTSANGAIVSKTGGIWRDCGNGLRIASGVIAPGWTVGVQSGHLRAEVIDSDTINDLGCHKPNRVAATTASLLNDDAWHHVVVVVGRASGITLYVDGVQAGSASGATPAALTNAQPLSIGGGFNAVGAYGPWAGALADVAVYATALTADQVAAHFAAASAMLDQQDQAGALESDQAAATADESAAAAAATPQATSPAGAVDPSTYTSEVWSGAEAGADSPLRVITSTAPGTFAMTGLAVDAGSSDPVAGAAVTLTSGGTTLSTTTDADGAYAFANVPAAAGAYDLTMAAPGYGGYTQTNNAVTADQTYQMTSRLGASAQAYDETTTELAAETQDLTAVAGSYYSRSRIPATINVKMMNVYPPGSRDSHGNALNCAPQPDAAQPSPVPIKAFATPFYLLHVAPEEVGFLNLNKVGMRAFFALELNFAWFHKTQGPPYDVTNSTDSQCFRPESAVDARWRGWLQTVLRHRVAAGDGSLVPTYYRGYGNRVEACADPAYAPGGGLANQNIIAGLSNPKSSCSTHFTDWRKLARYFYSGAKLVLGQVPPHPQTGYSVAGGAITFTFKSLWSVAGTRTAWSYLLQRYDSASSRWTKLVFITENSVTGSIRQSYTYAGGSGKCQKYRVLSGSPVGWSKASNYNGGKTICA